ncbi:MAG: hypothetical protein GXX86_12690 [Propionibacterium sp.]|nr:hypothetical protein [Propionibacterium sp.]
MVAVQIRDVPDGVRDALAKVAAGRGQSLQSYLLELLTREAERSRNLEVLQQCPVVSDPVWADADVVTTLHELRRERDEVLMERLE